VRIGLSFAALTNRGGIGRYARILAKGLPKLFPDNQWIGYIPQFRENETREIIDSENILGWETIVVPGSNRWAFETVGLKKILSENPPDIFHGPDYLVPDAPCPVCVTVHDLAFRLCPGGMAFKSRLLFNFLTPRSVKRAHTTGQVFCDSQSTLDDLRRLRWIPGNKGRVVHLACEDEFRARIDQPRIFDFRERYGVPDNYILYVGPVERRKNIDTLVRAYTVFAEVIERRGQPAPKLVAAGPLGSGGEKLLKKLIDGSDGRLIHVGYIGRDDLISLYAGCLFFCYPSRYEGFGLPPLEAMTMGKAVIVSNASSLPEVVGDAGVLIDPDDAVGWSQAILNLYANEKKRYEREELSKVQSAKFSVEKMCREVMDGYLQSMEGRHPCLPA